MKRNDFSVVLTTSRKAVEISSSGWDKGRRLAKRKDRGRPRRIKDNQRGKEIRLRAEKRSSKSGSVKPRRAPLWPNEKGGQEIVELNKQAETIENETS